MLIVSTMYKKTKIYYSHNWRVLSKICVKLVACLFVLTQVNAWTPLEASYVPTICSAGVCRSICLIRNTNYPSDQTHQWSSFWNYRVSKIKLFPLCCQWNWRFKEGVIGAIGEYTVSKDFSILVLKLLNTWSPDFFQASSFQLLKLEYILRWPLFTVMYNRSTNMNYFI